MSATTKNIFALLDSDDDEPVQKKAPVKATKSVPTAGKPVVAKNNGKKPFTKTVIPEPSKNDSVSRGSQNGERRRGARSNRGPRTEGEGGERRPRRQDGERRPPRREFDRRSGTGRDRAMKKEGAGARNWGSNEAEANTTPEAVAADAAADAADAVAEDESPAEEAAPVAEEPKTFTLDEFRARQAAERSQGEGFGELEIREVDSSEFSEFTVKEKADEESFFAGGATKQKRDKARKTKTVLGGKDVGFRAPPVERGEGRGDRGDRRGPRGERGERRGGDRRNNRAPNVGNSNDFPTLG